MPQPLPWRTSKGRHYEGQALAWLRARGLRLLCRNYRCRLGEIDLVLREGNMLVFLEVRFRSASSFVAPAATVTRAKQNKLRACARHFLLCNPTHARLPCRFDVLGISLVHGELCYDWIQGAFY